MLAYRSGIFPMADSRDDPEIFWIEPRMRAILPLDGLQVSHSLARSLRRGRFTVTCNAAFSQVMDACAAPRPVRACSDHPEDEEAESESWISHRIQRSYEALHRLGLAHSIECWIEGDSPAERTLAGGLYGVGFDGVFCGESMFSRQRDASKVALCWLVAALRRTGASLLDCQFITSHLASLGAIEISQMRYLELLDAAQAPSLRGKITPPSTRRPFPDQLAAPSASSAATSASDGAALATADGDSTAVAPLSAGFAALLDDAAGAGLSASPGKLIAQLLTQTS